MQALSVSVSQSKTSGLSRKTGMLGALVLAGATLLGAAPQARANDGEVVIATGLGAIAGAVIGHSIGGRNGTIVGGVVGAAIGASAATEGNRYRNEPYSRYSSDHYQGYQGYQGGYTQAAPVVYAQPVRVYRQAPAYGPVVQPVYRTVVRQVAYPVVYRTEYQGQYDSDNRRHSRGWDRGRYNGDRDDGHRHDRPNRGWDYDRGYSDHRR